LMSAAMLARKKEEEAAAVAAAAAKKKAEEEAAAAALLAAKEEERKKAAAAAAAATAATSEKAAAAAAGGGCMRFLPWLLALLLLAFLLWYFRGCFGCGDKTAMTTPPPIETPVDTVKAVVPVDTVEAEPEPPAPAPAVCDCTAATHPVFDLPSGRTAKTLTRLGTNPQFGNSHSLDPTGFYNKLKERYAKSGTDKRYLDSVFKAMGYENGFSDAKPDIFSNTTINRGQVGNMGYSRSHKTLYARLNATSDRDLQAFKIEAANGCDVQFMKTCGNHFFFCPN